ncbi:MAG: hybrid sensor histidine kinase/response regulator [Opitutaceae bacterium]|nr:hybrid sensor histidine kinase/response regulator [Cephaloticoccus sp.]MCP5531448.1 hybrid sensor histidine kinase/response regulator [Opitutaceae bacterium]
MVTETTPAATETVGKPAVLVVDDEYGPRESIAFTLSSEFAVDTASRANEALHKLRQKSYATVVLDIRMPEMDGIRALEELRKIDTDVSVIMLTGYGTLHTAQQAMVGGANQYLRKPPDVNELIEAVRKQTAATRMRRQQTEMNRRTQELNEALKQEIQKAEPHIWQSRASVELVHDLNNPLTVVIGYAALLVEEARSMAKAGNGDSGKLRDYAAVVERAAEYCHHLSENWRLASRNHVEYATVDLCAVAKEVRQVIFFDNQTIQFEGEPSALVRGSRFELMRVFQNLFKNALEAGATKLLLTVKQNGAQYELMLVDNGSGIPNESIKKVLKGGFSSKSGGTGLGLSICRHLLSAHGATFELESTAGAGTTVKMVFPAAKS